ncbi:MAG: DDE-type integrase/transposase/recombinase [Thaumarchaeota archaeon]|nr:DDE-type integrase/transposase/recombinase [Nitrososphaerota archaeon]MCL5317922.1 DDE-type integrase/transposase/recombinase [Nitrososphaerota archaeon]
MEFNFRQERGQEIAKLDGEVKRVDQHFYRVNSQSGNGLYDIIEGELGWLCSCPDHIYRGVKCKHIWAVEFSLTYRKVVAEIHTVVEPVQNPMACKSCGSSNLLKYGVRHNKTGDIQKYSCKDCGAFFTVNLGFEKMKSSPAIVTSAMQLYFSGLSLRRVTECLKLQGVNVSHVAVLKWIRKYVSIMEKYADSLRPNLGDTWRADELYVKMKGDMKYLFSLMDDQTKYWIAEEVADTKYAHDARRLFQMGKELAGKRPETLITDGLPSYNEAYRKEFWTAKKATRTEHIRHIHLQGDMNNNAMERFNGSVRDREKVMRSLKNQDTPIVKGYRLYFNFIREHQALDGKTPAEASGIQVKGNDKFMALIQNATISKTEAKKEGT